jgi:hypothetical protein
MQQGLGQDISRLVHGWNVRQNNRSSASFFTNLVILQINVLGSFVELRVSHQANCGLVVAVYRLSVAAVCNLACEGGSTSIQSTLWLCKLQCTQTQLCSSLCTPTSGYPTVRGHC